MPEVSNDEAIALARAATSMTNNPPARAWRVRRLDRPGDNYYLVVFGEYHAAIAVAAVGVAHGEIRSWAKLSGDEPHLMVSEKDAVGRAGLAEGAHVELVWRPSRASRSPCYPLWEVRTEDKVVYVDQQGSLWPSLQSDCRGG